VVFFVPKRHHRYGPFRCQLTESAVRGMRYNPPAGLHSNCTFRISTPPEVSSVIMTKSAVFFALRAHGMVKNEFGSLGQRRKYSGAPYENHLLEVANLVQTHGGDTGQIAAAWLHDVVEDTSATINEIESAFGSDVASLVRELTDIFTKASYPELNRKARKQLEGERLWKVSARAQTIKFADFVSNGMDILELNPEFGAVYVEEVSYALSGMHEGDFRLKGFSIREDRREELWHDGASHWSAAIDWRRRAHADP
jgi:hypothetical protein